LSNVSDPGREAPEIVFEQSHQPGIRDVLRQSLIEPPRPRGIAPYGDAACFCIELLRPLERVSLAAAANLTIPFASLA
jgi:hypothetical protein